MVRYAKELYNFDQQTKKRTLLVALYIGLSVVVLLAMTVVVQLPTTDSF